MNERWMRGALQALLFLLVPVLGACAVGRLSDRIVINARTQVTDEGGTPIKVGGPEDLLVTGSLLDGEGLKLQPGDLLTYTRWSPGLADGAAVSRHTHEPTSDRHQIALRLISTDGHLTSDEARFLSTVLTTQRKNWREAFGNDLLNEVAAVSGVLDRNKIHLWNALVRSIVLLRLQREVPGSDEHSRMLVAAVQIQALCAAIGKHAPEADMKLFAKAFIGPADQGCGTTSGRAVELTNPPEFPLSPIFAAASASRTSSDPHPFFVTTGQTYVQFNFTEVERNGVRVDRRDGPEARWTLREWERSGICKDWSDKDEEQVISDEHAGPVIRRLRLAGGRRKIWIHRASGDPSPTYHLQVRLNQSASSRWIERISDGTLFNEQAVLDQTALDVLRMADLDFVEWGSPNVEPGRRRAVASVRPNGCRFMNAD